MWYTSNSFQYLIIDDANRCIKESRNVKEVNVCADSLLSNLRGKGKREVLDILKDYWVNIITQNKIKIFQFSYKNC